jgi:hypothetical protein
MDPLAVACSLYRRAATDEVAADLDAAQILAAWHRHRVETCRQ